MKIFLIIALISLGLLSLSACAKPIQNSEFSTTPSKIPTGIASTMPVTVTPSSPLRVGLTFSKYPKLYEPVYIACGVYSIDDAPSISARIELPDGAELVSGNLDWQGDLVRYYGKYFTAQIIFNKSGSQTIGATVIQIIDDNNSRNSQDTVTLEFGPDGVLTSSLPDRRINRYIVIETSLEISHIPKLNEPTTLSVAINSPVDVPKRSAYGLNAVIIFPRGDYELLDGNNIVPINIKAGEPIHFSVVVIFKQPGSWAISACVEELVSGIYYYSPKDTIFLKISVG